MSVVPQELGQIRAALYAVVQAHYSIVQLPGDLGVTGGIQTYEFPRGWTTETMISLGGVVPDFSLAMSKGTDKYTFTVYAAISPNLDDDFVMLDAIVSGRGDLSLRQLIYANKDLGVPGLQAFMPDWDDYGGQLDIGGVTCLAARGTVVVHAAGGL